MLTESMPLIRQLVIQKNFLSCCAGALTSLLGVVILFKDLILAGTPDVLWADGLDSRLIYWIVNWGYHILLEQLQPLSLWNANSFYPHQLTLAYSDSLLGMQGLFAPLRMLGVSPLFSLYLTLAGVCIIGAMLTQHALCRIGNFSIAERVLITFSAHFSLSVISFSNHYQLFGFQLAPPFLLYLYLYLQYLKPKDLLILITLFFLGVSFAVYLAPMLLVLSIFMAVPILIKQIRSLGVWQLLQKIGIYRVGIVIACFLVFYLVQIHPYIKVAQSFPEQSFDETTIYSANLDSIFTGFPKFSFWYGPSEYAVYGAWEYAFFPGYVLLSLGLFYLLISNVNIVISYFVSLGKKSRLCRMEQMQQLDANLIPRSFLSFMLILFSAAIILSWGPYYKPNHSIQLPFYYLSKIIFGLRDIRAPGRFGMFVAMPLAVFTVGFLRLPVIRRLVGQYRIFLVIILIIVESFPTFPVFPFLMDSEGLYQQVSQKMEPGTPLMELPVFGKDHLETVSIALEQLNGSTIHWGRLMVGYGAKTTSDYGALLDLDRKIQQENLDVMEAFRFGNQYGITHFLVHMDRYDSEVAQKWQNITNEIGCCILFETSGTIFLEAGVSR